MYSMVLMAALTQGMDMPDMGRRGGRGGGCCGCCGGGMSYGGGGGGYGGGCYGMRMGGGCYGMGMGGGGYRMGWGGGYGSGYGMGWGGYGNSYALGSTPYIGGGYAYSPMWSGGYGTPLALGNSGMGNAGMNQSFFFNPANANQGNEATIIVHLPADATLTIDGEATRSRSNLRTFITPSLEQGKTYTYTLRAEMNRDGRTQHVKKTVDVRAGQPTEVTMPFDNADRGDDRNEARPETNRDNPVAPRRAPLDGNTAPRTPPNPPNDR